jgi:hypothetical protein
VRGVDDRSVNGAGGEVGEQLFLQFGVRRREVELQIVVIFSGQMKKIRKQILKYFIFKGVGNERDFPGFTRNQRSGGAVRGIMDGLCVFQNALACFRVAGCCARFFLL